MKINVTEEDIKNGEPGNCNACAISQALKRIFKVGEAYTEIEDETSSVLLTVNGKKYKVDEKTCMSTTDDDVKYFISDFDALIDPYSYPDPDPIEFHIEEIK
tara:strand:+ start:448 stop:753 length:306 start_codon:yes stop_codon:yes gene_type:complete